MFEIEAQLSPLTTIGPSPAGEVRLIPIVSGGVEGERLRGQLLPGGADWQDVRSDGGLEISARYLIETDQLERIEVRSVGLRTAAPEVLARLARGELPPMSEYYFRTAMRFRTSSPRIGWLNSLLGVSYGERRPASVHLYCYEVL